MNNAKKCKEEKPTNPKSNLNEYSLAGIGIGGIIGGGFFLGSSLAISQAGPSIILAFLFGGFIMSQVLGAMTSISINRPVQGTFRVFTEEFLGRFPAFILGWIIFISGVLILGAEAVATAVFLKYWFPFVPSAVFAIITIVIVIFINSLGMKNFGFIETIMAFIKIAILILFIVMGAYFLITHGITIRQNPFRGLHAFFPNNISGLLSSMLIVVFAYSGINSVDMATSEVRKPCYEIPKATVLLTIGLVILYVLSMSVIVTTVDWSQIKTSVSPFVQGFNRMGYTWASSLINGVIVIATFSVMLSNFYACVQILTSMARAKDVPEFLQKTTAKGNYRNSMITTGVLSILVVLMSFALGAKLFNYLISSSSYFTFLSWIINLLTFTIWMRKKRENEIYISPLIKGKWGAYITILIIIGLFFMSLGVHDFRIGFYLAFCITVVITLLYSFIRRKKL